MKKKVFLLIGFVSFISMQLLAQSRMSKVIAAQEIDWYGVDFTKTRMIGPEGFLDPDAIVNKYVHGGWNAVMKVEADKYDPGKPIGKKANIYFDVCNARNKKVTKDGLIIDGEYSITPDDVQAIISQYPKKADGGVGLVYIVESLNKRDKRAHIWMTFFDEKTGEVLLTEKVEGKAGGSGFRNYWLGAFHSVIKQSGKLYKKWVKDFG